MRLSSFLSNLCNNTHSLLLDANLKKKKLVTYTWTLVIHSLLLNLLLPTVSLAIVMSAATCTKSAFRSLSSPISNRVVGYFFTLSVQKARSSPSWFLKCPPHVTQFFCYLMNTFQLCCPPPRGWGGGTSYGGVYGEALPERGDFLEPAP